MRRVRLRHLLPVLIVAIAALVSAWQYPADSVPTAASGRTAATVGYVVDGDTIRLSDKRYVRFIGVNAPEISHPDLHIAAQPYGEAAKQHLEQLLRPGDRVELERDVSETDKYGRLLRFVYKDGQNLSIVMAHDGFAQELTIPPDVAYEPQIRAAVSEARAMHRGEWQ